MTTEPNEQTPITDRNPSDSPGLGRRQFTKASLAAPVLLSVATRPAWGTDTCSISGLMSGNLSRPDNNDCGGGGCTPGFWRNNWLPWQCAGYSPGWLTCADASKTVYQCRPNDLRIVLTNDPASSAWGHRTDTWGTMFGCEPPIGSGYSSSTPLLNIVDGSPPMNTAKTFAMHAVAAMLNASCAAVAYGSNADDLRIAICAVSGGGTFADMGMEEFKNVLDTWNNKGCPLGANQSFPMTTTVEGETVGTMYVEPMGDVPIVDEL